jgi:hypothetical protein
MIHEVRLYRSGHSRFTPMVDNQLWANCITNLPLADPGMQHMLNLQPLYGSAAALYTLELTQQESPEHNWTNTRARLRINADFYGDLPLSWYVGSPSDWPSGIARFPEVQGMVVPGKLGQVEARAVWTIAIRRDR